MIAPASILLAALSQSTAATPSEPWTLDRAVAYAQSHSPDAVTAQARIRQAEAGLSEATSTFLPQLSLGARYAVTNTPAFVFANIVNQEVFDPATDFNDLSTNDDLSLNATVKVPLYAGGARFAARRSASASKEAAEHGKQAVQRELGFQVTRAYLTVLQARAFREAADAAVDAFEANLEIAKRRFEAGSLLKQDLLDVEVRLSRAREDLVRIRNGESLALRALANVMGLDGAGPMDIAGTQPRLTVPQDGSVEDRPEIAALTQQVDAAKAGINRARAGFIPSVGAFGSVMFNQGLIENGNRGSFMAGVALEWQAFDGLGTQSRVRQAQEEASATAQVLRRARLGLTFEAEQARIRVDDLTERLGVTAKEVTLAEESAGLTRDRFEEGLAISTQLIDAETTLTAARVRRAQSKMDRLIAIAALRKALGLPILTRSNDGE